MERESPMEVPVNSLRLIREGNEETGIAEEGMKCHGLREYFKKGQKYWVMGNHKYCSRHYLEYPTLEGIQEEFSPKKRYQVKIE